MAPSVRLVGLNSPDFQNGRFVVFETDVAGYHVEYTREGVAEHFAKSDRTSFFPLGIRDFDSIYGLEGATVGVVGFFASPASVDLLESLKLPWLNLSESTLVGSIGASLSFRGEGTRGAKYFIDELGLSNLGFYGISSFSAHQRRLSEFQAVAMNCGLAVDAVMHEGISSPRFFNLDSRLIREQTNELTELIRALPKPCGVFCANDILALRLRQLARRHSISVPKELSILGVGSLHRATGGWQESVSVVQLNHRRMGIACGEMMESYLLSGIVPESVFLGPDDVIHRYTTLRRSVSDSLVREALERIQADTSITIDRLSSEVGVSRRILEMHFQKARGQAIGKTIDMERFTKAMHLMKNHSYNLDSIAALAGYASAQNMRRSFLRHLDTTPMDYRRSLKTPDSRLI